MQCTSRLVFTIGYPIIAKSEIDKSHQNSLFIVESNVKTAPELYLFKFLPLYYNGNVFPGLIAEVSNLFEAKKGKDHVAYLQQSVALEKKLGSVSKASTGSRVKIKSKTKLNVVPGFHMYCGKTAIPDVSFSII